MIKIMLKDDKVLYYNYQQAIAHAVGEYKKLGVDVNNVIMESIACVIDSVVDGANRNIGDTTYTWATTDEIIAEENRIASRNKPADILRVHCGVAND